MCHRCSCRRRIKSTVDYDYDYPNELTTATTFTICNVSLYGWRWCVFRVFDCMQNMLVVCVEFIFIVEEAEVCIVLLLCFHHYLHLNAVLRYEHCCTFYYRMHLLSLRLQKDISCRQVNGMPCTSQMKQLSYIIHVVCMVSSHNIWASRTLRQFLLFLI